MSKVRINDLARELEVKSKAILDVLTVVGVTEKKTHSSSLEEHEAEKVRQHLRGSSEGQSASAKSARTARGEDEIKTKIDLSHISRPGDVLKAITQRKEAAAPAAPTPARQATPPAPAISRPAVAPPAPKPPVPATPPAVAPVAPRPVAAPPVAERPAVTAAPPMVTPPRPVAPPPAVTAPTAPAAPTMTASAAPRPPVSAPPSS